MTGKTAEGKLTEVMITDIRPIVFLDGRRPWENQIIILGTAQSGGCLRGARICRLRLEATDSFRHAERAAC